MLMQSCGKKAAYSFAYMLRNLFPPKFFSFDVRRNTGGDNVPHGTGTSADAGKIAQDLRLWAGATATATL